MQEASCGKHLAEVSCRKHLTGSGLREVSYGSYLLRGVIVQHAAAWNIWRTQNMNDRIKGLLREYGMITAAIVVMSLGTYFFKFPNHFAFGGVSGLAAVINGMTGISATLFTNIANFVLLIVGFMFLGRSVGVHTVFATLVMTVTLELLEALVPMNGPLTDEPLLELLFAVLLPAIGSAVLFNMAASSGGTDIIAMILRKYTDIHIGTALLIVDAASVFLAFFVFGAKVGLYSLLGLIGKSLGIDSLIENMNRCKCFTVICDDPVPICEYITNTLHRGATVYHAEGAFTHHRKTVIMSTVRPHEAVYLRNYIKKHENTAFIQITNSSEIIGKGFMAG
jgi:uncharacterized membrane-anchored protein YitT (DUF2179 family)